MSEAPLSLSSGINIFISVFFVTLREAKLNREITKKSIPVIN